MDEVVREDLQQNPGARHRNKGVDTPYGFKEHTQTLASGVDFPKNQAIKNIKITVAL